MEQTLDDVNGIDVAGLREVIEEIGKDPAKGKVRFRVASGWTGQTRSEHRVEEYELGGETIARSHRFEADEPTELLGSNGKPNPQEYLLGALNACMLVGYATGAAVRGITLEKLEIESTGELDLRGFLGIDASVNPGYDTVDYVVRIKGDGTPEQMREIHETVQKTSPNYTNYARPIRLCAELIVE
jgi:uncharacterized OsmC-like protein